MTQRTDTGRVQALLADNYDGQTDVQQFIDTATVIVDRVVQQAARKIRPVTLLDPELELIERWLACHFYCLNDPLYMNKGEDGASGSHQRAPAVEGFESTDYGKGACRIDYSGCLRAIGRRDIASVAWLGKPPSAQIDAEDRD